MRTASLTLAIALSHVACFVEENAGGESNVHEPGDGDSQGDGGASVEGGVEGVFARVCERLHGDCASVCDNLFFECYDDVASCTEQWQLDYLSDYTAPLVDDALVERCGAQVETQACTDLRPDTAECEYAIVESCLGDEDAHGAIYSPFSPGVAVLGEVIEVELCAWVEEYFAIELEQGATLDVIADDDALLPGFVDILELVAAPDGDTVIERSSLGTATAHGGTYVLAVESGESGSFRFAVVPAQ